MSAWAPSGPLRSMLPGLLLVLVFIGVLQYIKMEMRRDLLPEESSPQIEVIQSDRGMQKDSVAVVGIVKNAGTQNSKSFKVEVSFYDKEKKLIDVESAYINETLKAGEIRPFKVKFGSCGKLANIKNYDHFTTTIRK